LNNILPNNKWIIKEIRGEIKNFLESNENEDMIYQNLWDKANVLHQKRDRSQTIIQMMNLKLLGKKRTSQTQNLQM
jgi:hypothetical protein